MKTIVISAFEPFGMDQENASLTLLESFNTMKHPNTIIKVVLPVVYELAYERLKEVLSEFTPDAVVMLGLAGGRKDIQLERIAINIADSKNPDNEGTIHVNQPIIKDGREGYFSTLPLVKIVASAESKNLPISISNTAGTYVCNHLFYSVMHDNKPAIPCGFIHVPYLPHMVSDQKIPSIELETMNACLDHIISNIF